MLIHEAAGPEVQATEFNDRINHPQVSAILSFADRI